MSDVDCDTSPAPGTRAAYAALLLTLVGWNGLQDRYRVLVDPAGSPSEQRQVAEESDCMVGALGAEELFFDVRRTTPYVPASAPALLEKRAGGTPMSPGGAMRKATAARPPDVADLVWYGFSASSLVKAEHVEHPVDVRVLGVGELEADVVAFGERVLPEEADALGAPAGTEVVKKLTRTWKLQGSLWIEQSTLRPIVGVVDFDLLKLRLGLLEAAS